MSSLKHDLVAAARDAGGSFKTRANRTAAVGRFIEFLRGQNLSGLKLANLKTRNVEAYARAMLEHGRKARTVQSELSALRTTLRACGRGKISDNLDNKSLGIAGASRAGVRTATPEEKREQIVANLLARGHEGVAACVNLQRALGLRGREAVMSGPSLETWRKALAAGRPVPVTFGAKGGRPREVHPADVERAIEAVNAALAVANQNNRKLIARTNLKAALAHYRDVMHNAGATGKHSGHSLRYAFARQQMRYYEETQGLTEREALARTSLDLGHGDGRGRYIKQVYLR